MSANTNSNNPIDNETRDMLRSFVSEAFDSLDTNEPIVEVLRNDNNEESVNSIFRVFHTLKGLSGFFEMNVINKVTHEAETLLDIMRKQNRKQNEETITVVYQTFDFLRDLLQRVSNDYTDKSAEVEAEDMILVIKDSIEKVKENAFKSNEVDTPMSYDIKLPVEIKQEVATVYEESKDEIVFVDNEFNEMDDIGNADEIPVDVSVDFQGDSLISDDMLDQYLINCQELLDNTEKNLLTLETDPNNDQIVRETFGFVHSLKGNSGFMGFNEIEEISVEMETILDSIRNKALEPSQNVITVLLSNIETVRNRLEKISKPADKPAIESKPKTTENARIEPPAKLAVVKEKPTIVSQPVAKVEEKVDVAITEEKPALQIKKTDIKDTAKAIPPAAIQRKDIRVETTKIDKLFDLVGELITIETMVTHSPDLNGLELPNFNKSANMLNKITRELQEISMSIRMMPLEGQFNKMKRLVRDVALKMNKKVNFTVSGQDTEMDKNVIDEISDPLVHILRNSLDHGVESPEDRIAAGKEEIGTVSLSARYEGNEILIIVDDDGKGIDRDRILQKAEEKGLLKVPPETMRDRDVFALIFEPGFSTAAKVTDISGRGVGMDVVRKNIEKLRGTVDVNSVLNKGTRITLRIPLTLAIMEAMLIRIGEDTFALPILAIRESFRPIPDIVTVTMDGLEVVKVRQEIYPVIRMHELFNKKPDSYELHEGILIIIEARERKICLFADEIVGQQQAVIKGLSDYIGKVPGITGCMILGDGGIGLIVDIESLIDMAQQYDEKK